MDAINSITQLFKKNRIELNRDQAEQLIAYKTFLLEWNKKINLISRSSIDTFDSLHLLDSACPIGLLPIQLPILDLGCGGGLPGIVLKIMRPEWNITLCDSKQKKINYLQKCIETLNFEKIDVCNAAQGKPEKKYGMVICRAFSSLSGIIKEGHKYLRPGGIFAAYKGRLETIKEELAEIPNHYSAEVIPYSLKTESELIDRHLVLIKKYRLRINMGKKIAVSNQKGGVGKTTTAVNLASALTTFGKKVLLADIDAQGNSCSGLGLHIDDDMRSMYDVLLLGTPAQDIILHTHIPDLDIIPVNAHLSGAAIELSDVERREFRLKQALEDVIDLYDYIIIDCPPALDLLTLNGLTAADSVLIPIQCEYYALEGMTKLMKTISLVQSSLNPQLSIEGILLTMYDSRTNLSNQVVEEVTSYFKESVFQTIIPRTVKISEAPSHGTPIDKYDPSGTGAKGYLKLAEEVINNG